LVALWNMNTAKTSSGRRCPPRDAGITRVEIVAVLAALGLLGAAVLPALARSRQPASHLACANNLRQLGQAMLMFSAENNHYFPPRTMRPGWPARLLEYYGNTNVLRCPGDIANPAGGIPGYGADSAPRSYIYNAWNDYFLAALSAQEFQNYISGRPPDGIPESAIKLPNATIAFGEKVSGISQSYLDLVQVIEGGDVTALEFSRHFSSPQNRLGGGSNYAFADGSVRLLKYWASLWPTCLWATEEDWRTNMPPLFLL
jgi:prepilin-type processing-associated H-X9-DG protein